MSFTILALIQCALAPCLVISLPERFTVSFPGGNLNASAPIHAKGMRQLFQDRKMRFRLNRLDVDGVESGNDTVIRSSL